jgi:hypothetical protein
MLPQMVLPVECSRVQALLYTALVVVCGQVLFTGLELVAVNALVLASRLVDNYVTQRCADPLLQ